MTLQALIDKQDNVEIVRDKIAAILATESANQQTLATAAAKDPALWKLRVFRERAIAWEQFLDAPVTDQSPLLNVWFDDASYQESASNISERSECRATINVDCYGYGVAEADGAGGHDPGDRTAAFAAQRAARLVRNILMAAENTYLQLRGVVGQRWPQSMTAFQPTINDRPVQNLWAVRISWAIRFLEFSPQFVGEPLELVAADVIFEPTGEVIARAHYDYTV